jgi:large subunit ribosomal protein L17
MAMLRAMVTFLLENGKIETTVTRAKEVRSITEKMITIGKKNTLHAKRQALSFITKEDVVKKLFDEIAPKYSERNGGYTRIMRTGPRRGERRKWRSSEIFKFLKTLCFRKRKQRLFFL